MRAIDPLLVACKSLISRFTSRTAGTAAGTRHFENGSIAPMHAVGAGLAPVIIRTRQDGTKKSCFSFLGRGALPLARDPFCYTNVEGLISGNARARPRSSP